MGHYMIDYWARYVRNELDEKENRRLEEHLYTCDACLQHYMAAIERNEAHLPESTPGLQTERIAAAIMCEYEQRHRRQEWSRQKQKVVHYFIAAGMTIMLLFSGAFQTLASYVGDVHDTTVAEHRQSLTEQVLERLLAQPDDEHNGGERHDTNTP